MSGTVHTWLEVEHTIEHAEDDINARQDHLFELKLWDDKIVFYLKLTPKPAECKRHGERAWVETKLFGFIIVGLDVARPGSSGRYWQVISETPWIPKTDEDALESQIWAVRDESLRLAALLAKKPDGVSLGRAIQSS